MFGKHKGLDFKKPAGGKNRAFIAVTVVCAALLTGALSFLVLLRNYDYDLNNIVRTTAQTTESATAVSETHSVRLSGTASVLFVQVSDDKSQVRGIFYVVPDLDTKRIDILPISPEETAEVNGKALTHTESFTTLGVDGIRKSTEASVGKKADRFILITDSGVVNALKYLGDLSYTLDSKLIYKSDELVLDLPKGEQLISPDNVLRLIKYNCITAKENRSVKNAGILTAVFENFYNESFSSKSEKCFTSLINLVQSDISAVDFAEHKIMIDAFASDSEKTVSVVSELKSSQPQGIVTEEPE